MKTRRPSSDPDCDTIIALSGDKRVICTNPESLIVTDKTDTRSWLKIQDQSFNLQLDLPIKIEEVVMLYLFGCKGVITRKMYVFWYNGTTFILPPCHTLSERTITHLRSATTNVECYLVSICKFCVVFNAYSLAILYYEYWTRNMELRISVLYF